MSEWKPIETAPKGSNYIIGYDDKSGLAFVCWWNQNPAFPSGVWVQGVVDGDNKGHLFVCTPTKWMPLAGLPKEREDE